MNPPHVLLSIFNCSNDGSWHTILYMRGVMKHISTALTSQWCRHHDVVDVTVLTSKMQAGWYIWSGVLLRLLRILTEPTPEACLITSARRVGEFYALVKSLACMCWEPFDWEITLWQNSGYLPNHHVTQGVNQGVNSSCGILQESVCRNCAIAICSTEQFFMCHGANTLGSPLCKKRLTH